MMPLIQTVWPVQSHCQAHLEFPPHLMVRFSVLTMAQRSALLNVGLGTTSAVKRRLAEIHSCSVIRRPRPCQMNNGQF
ncbi:hypothetical protein CY34DRAFT_402509 [Suillus luteus UH-Slu-Lm8-n1]|uniref:Uncharacterized protein n=1 Tax=Suillus luteus UH-Slu-Lm8-n1 TaxID=930992 RepID=A0A0D0AJE1_9AGAM|nr:hypothetical protein CY34DRAFT_402509 [Suillus luteus UH-Slu-Lm8-n1]